MPGRRRLAFQAGHGLDELLLDDEIEEEYGQDNDGCGGHDGVPALLGEGVVAGEGDGQRGQFVAADDEEGPEEGFPRPVEIDDNCGKQERPGDWIGNLEEDVEVVGAVDGGVDVLVREGERGLAQQENGEGRDGAGQDDSGVCVEQPETVNLEEEGDLEELLRGQRFVPGEGWAVRFTEMVSRPEADGTRLRRRPPTLSCIWQRIRIFW